MCPVVPTSWQDEALARDGVSREVPCSALKVTRMTRLAHWKLYTLAEGLVWKWTGKLAGVLAGG